MKIIYCEEKGGVMDYIKKNWYWFIIIGIVLLCLHDCRFLNMC